MNELDFQFSLLALIFAYFTWSGRLVSDTILLIGIRQTVMVSAAAAAVVVETDLGLIQSPDSILIKNDEWISWVAG